ncbi:hypothetical protein GGF46_005159 [Coemansia sp. RSA 552]|nr:hypothetical protein GGF46_005159 [Coemansia sp. RSA 552]
MDQLCVICKSATYHEHDALTASLRKQFWQMIPMSLFVWGDWESQEQEENVSLLACVRIQGEVMKTIIFHEHTIQYNPSNRYIVTFLKAYIDLVECAPNYSLDDELMEFYVSLVTTTDTSAAPHAMCFKTYTLDKEQYTRIVDDPTVVPTLVQALKVMVRSSQQVVYITVTIRDPETFDMFLAQIDNSEVLGRSVMDLTETQMTTLCHPNPTADIRLVLITRK